MFIFCKAHNKKNTKKKTRLLNNWLWNHAANAVPHFLSLFPHTVAHSFWFSFLSLLSCNPKLSGHFLNQIHDTSNHAMIDIISCRCNAIHSCSLQPLIGWAAGRVYLYLSWHTTLSTNLHYGWFSWLLLLLSRLHLLNVI